MEHQVMAQNDIMVSKSVFTCNISGIPPKDRARYERLVELLRDAILERRELPNGYSFRIDTGLFGSGQLVEWIELEKKCCPFFSFEVRWDQPTVQFGFILEEQKGQRDSF